MTKRRIISGSLRIDVLLSFLFGILFLSIMLGFSIFFPNPSQFQLRVFIPVLGLAAAGVGAVIPGVLDVSVSKYIRAGGAAAFFVIIFFFKPTIEQNIPTFIRPAQPAEPVALTFLHLLDENRIEDSWSALDPESQRRLEGGLSKWRSLFVAVREPLGRGEQRTIVNETDIQNPPNYPVGIYHSFTFRTYFPKVSGCRLENVAVRAVSPEAWKVFDYTIAPIDIPCG